MLLVWDVVAMITGLYLAFHLSISSHELGFLDVPWSESWMFLTDQTAIESSYRTNIN